MNKQIELKRGELVDLLNQEQAELQKNMQIEEMAKDLKEIEEKANYNVLQETLTYVKKYNKYNSKEDYSLAHMKTVYQLTAEEMFKKGYQKVDKNKQVVLTKEEYDNLKLEIQKAHNKGVRVGFDLTKYKENSIEKTRKETAEKIFNNLLKEFYKRKSCGNADVVVYEIAKQYGVEVDNE